MTTVKVKGVIFSGALRGSPLIKLFFHRLIGILGFEPFEGTMDVKLERPINIQLYSTKNIEHVLLDGTKKVDAYLAPAILTIRKGNETIDYECWAMRQADGIYSNDILEIIARDNIKEKFSLKDDDEIELTLFEQKRPRKKIITPIISRLYGREVHLTKS